MQLEKTKWRKPEMIVLVRSRPEEAVLTACKGPSMSTSPGKSCGKPGNLDDCIDIVKS